jgi:hypothetical protein
MFALFLLFRPSFYDVRCMLPNDVLETYNQFCVLEGSGTLRTGTQLTHCMTREKEGYLCGKKKSTGDT